MKKLLFLIAAFALVAAACNKTSDNNNQTPTTQIYSNATYGFEFTYPVYMKFVGPTYASLQDKIVQLQIGQEQYPNTNFSDAAFAISATAPKDLADCLAQNPPEGSDGFKTKVTINGIDFYMTGSTGAAAGNLYESKIYRTMRGAIGDCIELNETIHTSNIGNYPAGAVTEVDKADVQAKLDSILNTFKFTR
ncbi:MAG TPA: hypothetical protein VGQ87_00580 [Patescibacteria group bacterium]|nr:hypothetical protein [Patescibacteria group bacterium]